MNGRRYFKMILKPDVTVCCKCQQGDGTYWCCLLQHHSKCNNKISKCILQVHHEGTIAINQAFYTVVFKSSTNLSLCQHKPLAIHWKIFWLCTCTCSLSFRLFSIKLCSPCTYKKRASQLTKFSDGKLVVIEGNNGKSCLFILTTNW